MAATGCSGHRRNRRTTSRASEAPPLRVYGDTRLEQPTLFTQLSVRRILGSYERQGRGSREVNTSASKRSSK
jgi:hypothetical protein